MTDRWTELLETQILLRWQSHLETETFCHFCSASVPQINVRAELIPHDDYCIVRKLLARAVDRNVK